MKPYFQSGQDYLQFHKNVLKEDLKQRKVQILLEQPDAREPTFSFVQTYLIKNPRTSRLLFFWEVIWLLVLLIEFTLVPYTICTGIAQVLAHTNILEMAIDCLWILHIFLISTTAFVRDGELVTSWRQILVKYCKEGLAIDVVSTAPTLVTFYKDPRLYYLKLLRLYYVTASQKIIERLIQALEQRLNISKQAIYKIDYFMRILVIAYLTMHSITCTWLLVGETYANSWIHNPNIGLNAVYGII
jgi:hypothetical protein